MKDKLILKDGTAVELEAAASLGALQVASTDREAMLAIWASFTPDNLSEVTVQTGEGLTVGRYENLVLVSESSVVASDGSVLTTYHLREKTAEEVQMEALLAEQEIQNEAIAELAVMAAGGGE